MAESEAQIYVYLDFIHEQSCISIQTVVFFL